MTRPTRCKQHRDPRIRFRAPSVALFALSFALAFDSTGILRIGLLCALLHETGHILVYRRQWHHWPDLQLSLFGVRLLLRGQFLSSGQELLLAAAGPAFNLLGCSVALFYMNVTGHYCYAGYWFASTNLLVGGVNLLPLPGLDGARILHSFLR